MTVGLTHLGQGFPPYLRILALALRAQDCASAGVSPSCPADAEASARSALETDPYRFNVLLLPARIALFRLDLQHGAKDVTSNALAEALSRIDAAVPATHPFVQEARLWMAVLKAKQGDCMSAAIASAATHPGWVAAQQAWSAICAP